MSDARVDPDSELVGVLNETARRVLRGERAYEAALETMSKIALGPILLRARHGGAAYALWAAISDLKDGPDAPESHQARTSVATEAASDWLSIDAGSPEKIAQYFERWVSRDIGRR